MNHLYKAHLQLKELSQKLYEWTKKRWVITFSQKEGNPTKKQMAELEMKKIFDEVRDSFDFGKLCNSIVSPILASKLSAKGSPNII